MRLHLYRQGGLLRKWRTRLVSGNGAIADASHQGFVRRQSAIIDGVTSARAKYPDAVIQVVNTDGALLAVHRPEEPQP